MAYAGFKGLLDILNMLKKKKIHYYLEHMRDDTILIRATLVGVRLEIEVFEDSFEFSYFTGDESVETDVSMLNGLVEKHWD